MTRQRWLDLACLVLLLLLPLLLFAPVTLGSKTLLPGDIYYGFEPFRSATPASEITAPQNGLLADLVLENYLWKQFIVQALRQGQLPLWDPYLFTGHPFLANGQHSGLYPLSIIYYLFPLPRAYGIFTVVQLGLAGIWMYVLVRVLRTGRLGALLAGITFELSGFLLVSVVHPMILAAASWLPLLLALIELTVRRAPFGGRGPATLPWALLGAAALGLQLLAGHAEITYFVLLVMGAFALWRLVYTAATTPRTQWLTAVGSPLMMLVLLGLLGLGFGAVQLIPLYETVRGSFRQGAVTLSQVRSWAYPLRHLITFLIPNFYGNPAHHTLRDLFTGAVVPATVNAQGQPIDSFFWGIKNYVEGGVYLGVLPLLLALLAVVKGEPASQRISESTSQRIRVRLVHWLRQPYVPFFTLLTLFSLGCMFGTPLYALVYALPFLNQSHSPFRWVFPFTVAMAALAGIGAQRVSESASQRTNEPTNQRTTQPALRILWLDTTPSWVSALGVLTFWSGVLWLVGLWASRWAFAQVEPWIERAFWALALASDAFPDPRAFYSYLFPWIQLAGFMLLTAGIVLRVSRCPIYLPRRLGGRPIWELLAVVVLVVDKVTFGAGFNPATDPALLTVTPPVVEFLRQDQGLWRFSTFDPFGAKTFNANTGMLFGFQDVRGYDSLFSAQYARYMGWIEPQGELPYNRIAPFTRFDSLDSPLTDLLNVKYILSEIEIPLPKYKEVCRQGELRVYENLAVMPRAYTLPQSATLVVPNVEAIQTLIQTYDPRFYVMVEENAGSGSAATPVRGEPQPQPVVAYEINQVVVEAQTDLPAWLVLLDAYAPGWKAFVRPVGTDETQETEVPIVRVAGNFRGVPLKPGAWTVRFRYSPDSVKVGAFTSFLAGMVWLFLALLWGWRRGYREPAGTETVQRVAKNSIAPIVLNLFNRALDFALAALMLRILGPANAGDYYYAIVIFGWFEILTNFGLDAYLTREVACNREQSNRYLFNTTAVRLALSIGGIPLLVGLLALRQTLIAPALNAQTITAIALLYVGLVPGSLAKGLTSLFYAYEKAEYPAAISTVSALLKAALGAAVLLLGWGVVGLAGTSIVINLVAMGILGGAALKFFFKPHWEPDGALRRSMMAESWPLMLNHLLATLFFKVDVVLLEAIQGSAVVGWYSTAYKFLDALNIIPAMFTMAVFPVLSRQAREDQNALLFSYRLGVKLLVTLALPAALVGTLLARELVLILGDVAYLPHSMIALQLMIWSIPIGWINSLTNYVLIALGQQRYLTRAFVVGLAFNVLANLLFIPRFGYPASAVITILSELALLIPFAIGLQRQVGAVGWERIVARPALAGLAMGAAALALLPVGRLVALAGGLAIYGLVAWRIRLLTPEEYAQLRPVLKR